MSLHCRLRVPALLLAALSALLIFAAAASAETRTGESTTVERFNAPSLETSLVKASASYDTTDGGLSASVTTEAEPQLENATSTLEVLFSTPRRDAASPYRKGSPPPPLSC
jgi:hypothetical protein